MGIAEAFPLSNLSGQFLRGYQILTGDAEASSRNFPAMFCRSLRKNKARLSDFVIR
jgi:hypothetical protein